MIISQTQDCSKILIGPAPNSKPWFLNFYNHVLIFELCSANTRQNKFVWGDKWYGALKKKLTVHKGGGGGGAKMKNKPPTD